MRVSAPHSLPFLCFGLRACRSSFFHALFLTQRHSGLQGNLQQHPIIPYLLIVPGRTEPSALMCRTPSQEERQWLKGNSKVTEKQWSRMKTELQEGSEMIPVDSSWLGHVTLLPWCPACYVCGPTVFPRVWFCSKLCGLIPPPDPSPKTHKLLCYLSFYANEVLTKALSLSLTCCSRAPSPLRLLFLPFFILVMIKSEVLEMPKGEKCLFMWSTDTQTLLKNLCLL